MARYSRRRDRLSTKATARLQAGLIAGDPTGEVALAWTVAQDLMAFYQLTDPVQARRRAETLIADLRDCPIPELAPVTTAVRVSRSAGGEGAGSGWGTDVTSTG